MSKLRLTRNSLYPVISHGLKSKLPGAALRVSDPACNAYLNRGKRQLRSLRYYLLAILSLALANSASAQRDRDTYNPNNQVSEVSGQITIAETKDAARNIPVRLERFSGGIIDQITSDSRGRFRFGNLARGYYRVIVNVAGYHPVQQDADLTLLSRTYLVFELIPDKKSALSGVGSIADVIDARVPVEAREQYEQGRAALAKKDYSSGTAHLEKAVALYPNFYEAYLLLATAFIDTRNWDKAEDSLNHALELRANSAPATVSLGEVYWRQKRSKEAEETLLAGLKLDEKSWHAHFTLARLYWEMNEVMKAAPHVGMTLQLRPDFAEAHLLAGNVLLKVNQPQRALTEYEEYLRLAPKGEFAAQTRELTDKLRKSLAQNK
jgi:tetratricopeptide (TPR) repeat protein